MLILVPALALASTAAPALNPSADTRAGTSAGITVDRGCVRDGFVTVFIDSMPWLNRAYSAETGL
jgi:hypothetical protein